jgi:hypothetical protein
MITLMLMMDSAPSESYGFIPAPTEIGILMYGFAGYFNLLIGVNISSLLCIYGFPKASLGFALKQEYLKEVECTTTKAAFAWR